jgi:hypothetical protein
MRKSASLRGATMGNIHTYLFEAKGIQRYIFASGRLRDAAAASDLIARLASSDKNDLVAAFIARCDPPPEFSRRAGGAFCIHFGSAEARDRFRASWRVALFTVLPGLEFVEGCGEGDSDADAIEDARSRQAGRCNSIAQTLPLGGPATHFSPRTGRPALPLREDAKQRWSDLGAKEAGEVDLMLEPARRRSFTIEAVERGPPLRPQYSTLLRRVLPKPWTDDPAHPADGKSPILAPRNLTDEVVDRLDNPLFPFPRDVERMAMVHADLSGLAEFFKSRCRGMNAADRLTLSTKVEEVVLDALRSAIEAVAAPAARSPPALFEAVYDTDKRGQQTRRRDEAAKLAASEAAKVRVLALRPLVAGGDDVTVLIASEYALPFTRRLLEGIEDAGLGLSACAGIALADARTPFLMLHALAEGLCAHAKAAAKHPGREAASGGYRSAIAFHAPMGALGEDFEDIAADHLLTSGVALTMAPYWLRETDGPGPSAPAVERLTAALAGLGGRGALRALRTSLDAGLQQAQAAWTRWRTVRRGLGETLDALDDALRALGVGEPHDTFVGVFDGRAATPLFDALTMLSLESGADAKAEAAA